MRAYERNAKTMMPTCVLAFFNNFKKRCHCSPTYLSLCWQAVKWEDRNVELRKGRKPSLYASDKCCFFIKRRIFFEDIEIKWRRIMKTRKVRSDKLIIQAKLDKSTHNTAFTLTKQSKNVNHIVELLIILGFRNML